nr:uncharacterized protein LOC128690494 [Cherax quadricarinatus]
MQDVGNISRVAVVHETRQLLAGLVHGVSRSSTSLVKSVSSTSLVKSVIQFYITSEELLSSTLAASHFQPSTGLIMKVIFTIMTACLAVQVAASTISRRSTDSTGTLDTSSSIVMPGRHQLTPKRQASHSTAAATAKKLPEQGDPIGGSIVFSESELVSAGGKSIVKSVSSNNATQTPSVFFPGEKRGTNNAGIVFPTETTINTVSNRGTCSMEYASTMVNGVCERFLTQGQCAQGEWLLLREAGPVCVPRPCPFGQLFYNKRCVNVTDVSVCREGQMLYVDFSGFSMCDCEPGYIYDALSGKCYARHDKGPCGFGEYVEMSVTGELDCVPSPCRLDGFVKDSVTKRCYRKTYRGFCEDNIIFHRENNTAECPFVDIRNILDVVTLRACPPGSLRDFLNECRQQFIIPGSTSSSAFNNRCSGGFVMDSRGTCRRATKLLG